jgi:hypothetical protein
MVNFDKKPEKVEDNGFENQQQSPREVELGKKEDDG